MGGGVFWKVKIQSAKIWLNFNFQGRGVFWIESLVQGKHLDIWEHYSDLDPLAGYFWYDKR